MQGSDGLAVFVEEVKSDFDAKFDADISISFEVISACTEGGAVFLAGALDFFLQTTYIKLFCCLAHR